jgi:glucosamine--fructose-6-phosphate aminotransferase (isomerizing)
MCGIVGYIGKQNSEEVLLKGLKRLEYRGYDSSGISVITEANEIKTIKSQGKIIELEKKLNSDPLVGFVGMGHTRWATHGEPNDINAHPHSSYSGELAIVHNGIIENYAELKNDLLSKGFEFKGETDSEVLINFIEDIKNSKELTIQEAITEALSLAHGTYAIVVLSKENPNELHVARKGSPLVIGIGDGEYFVASDATPIIEYTNKMVYLEDEQLSKVSIDGVEVFSMDGSVVDYAITEVDIQADSIERDGYDHFMLKEINEQPKVFRKNISGRVRDSSQVTIDGIEELEKAKRIIIVSCGTSWHAGLYAEYLFEEFTRIPVEVEYASEFRYRNPVIYKDDVVIAISQSGETADTLAAIELAKESGAYVLGMCNVVGSSIARMSDSVLYTHADPEIGVASTKTFTTQLQLLNLIALQVGLEKGTLSKEKYSNVLEAVLKLPELLEDLLKSTESIKEIASEYKDFEDFLYLGRGYNFPIALEGAIKLKEISYVHAEGYPAAEMKHGPIALIDETMPVFVIATNDQYYEKIVSNVQEVKARKANIIAVVTEGDSVVTKLANKSIVIPSVSESIAPILSTVIVQLFSYYVAVSRGCNVDQPRNLAKSVTVE